jgi:hypothetical protein
MKSGMYAIPSDHLIFSCSTHKYIESSHFSHLTDVFISMSRPGIVTGAAGLHP